MLLHIGTRIQQGLSGHCQKSLGVDSPSMVVGFAASIADHKR